MEGYDGLHHAQINFAFVSSFSILRVIVIGVMVPGLYLKYPARSTSLVWWNSYIFYECVRLSPAHSRLVINWLEPETALKPRQLRALLSEQISNQYKQHKYTTRTGSILTQQTHSNISTVLNIETDDASIAINQ